MPQYIGYVKQEGPKMYSNVQEEELTNEARHTVVIAHAST